MKVFGCLNVLLVASSCTAHDVITAPTKGLHEADMETWVPARAPLSIKFSDKQSDDGALGSINRYELPGGQLVNINLYPSPLVIHPEYSMNRHSANGTIEQISYVKPRIDCFYFGDVFRDGSNKKKAGSLPLTRVKKESWVVSLFSTVPSMNLYRISLSHTLSKGD